MAMEEHTDTLFTIRLFFLHADGLPKPEGEEGFGQRRWNTSKYEKRPLLFLWV